MICQKQYLVVMMMIRTKNKKEMTIREGKKKTTKIKKKQMNYLI